MSWRYEDNLERGIRKIFVGSLWDFDDFDINYDQQTQFIYASIKYRREIHRIFGPDDTMENFYRGNTIHFAVDENGKMAWHFGEIYDATELEWQPLERNWRLDLYREILENEIAI
jgi:hypothetical protein